MHTGDVALGQALDIRRVDGSGGCIHRAPGDHTVASDFGQRHQYERTLEQARMRQRQIGFV